MAKSPNTLGVELDLPPEWPVYTAAEREAVSDLVGHGRTFDYGRGPEIADLEGEGEERGGLVPKLPSTGGQAPIR